MAKKSLIFLNLLGLGPKKISKIITKFADTEEILAEKVSSLEKIAFFDASDIKKISELKKSGALDRELELIEKKKIDCLDIFNGGYPSLLKEIDNPPLVLYIAGNKEILNKFLFAIVGTRIPTIYGISMAQRFSFQLSMMGIGIVSGLARGVDSIVHEAAVKGGVSAAVLGSGLFNIYPRENKQLAQEVSQNGAVVSEFPLYAPPLKENFPRRNRIISGLSKGVLVVEAASRSGALITAHLAVEQNREVFALPGHADSSLSKGAHKLIKEGAKLVDSLEDILEELNLEFENEQSRLPLRGTREAVVCCLAKT